MKKSPERSAARKENLAQRRKLTELIDTQTQERKRLANLEAQDVAKFKEYIIRQIAASTSSLNNFRKLCMSSTTSSYTIPGMIRRSKPKLAIPGITP